MVQVSCLLENYKLLLVIIIGEDLSESKRPSTLLKVLTFLRRGTVGLYVDEYRESKLELILSPP